MENKEARLRQYYTMETLGKERITSSDINLLNDLMIIYHKQMDDLDFINTFNNKQVSVDEYENILEKLNNIINKLNGISYSNLK